MKQFGKIIQIQGREVTISLDGPLNPEYLKLLADSDDNYVNLQCLDNRGITAKQNNLSHVLLRDISKHFNFPEYRTKEELKEIYLECNEDGFSHSIATREEANRWIEFLIEFIIENGVELPKRYDYLLEYDKFFYYSCKYRSCCICGKPNAQIHHVTAVGNRHRNNVDHREFPFASLCWVHHNVAHDLGQEVFLSRYKVLPVYLDKEVLIKIGITSNAQLLRFDEKYETEDLFTKATEEKREGG